MHSLLPELAIVLARRAIGQTKLAQTHDRGYCTAVSLLSDASNRQLHQNPQVSPALNELNRSFKCSPTHRKQQPRDTESLKFGAQFSDHMLTIKWSSAQGWERPKISQLKNLELHPAAKVFHYAEEVFEGMKAFRGVDNCIRLFRPELNMRRLKISAVRSALPDFDGEELLACITDLVRVEQEWVPHSTTCSLYIRPTLIGTEPILGVSHSNTALLFVIVGPVGAYYPSGFKPITLYADPQYCRAWPGGVGYTKAGSNYGPSILTAKIATSQGCHGVLWLFGPDEWLTEVGAMNLFVFWRNERDELELVTAPLTDGLILGGVVRQSVLEITREWNEFKVSERYVSMRDIRKAVQEKRLLEIFGSGTACVVAPVEGILYKRDSEVQHFPVPTMSQPNSVMQRVHAAITNIQYGLVSRPAWTRTVTMD